MAVWNWVYAKQEFEGMDPKDKEIKTIEIYRLLKYGTCNFENDGSWQPDNYAQVELSLDTIPEKPNKTIGRSKKASCNPREIRSRGPTNILEIPYFVFPYFLGKC